MGCPDFSKGWFLVETYRGVNIYWQKGTWWHSATHGCCYNDKGYGRIHLKKMRGVIDDLIEGKKPSDPISEFFEMLEKYMFLMIAVLGLMVLLQAMSTAKEITKK